jgi:hypothetical protein
MQSKWAQLYLKKNLKKKMLPTINAYILKGPPKYKFLLRSLDNIYLRSNREIPHLSC